MPKAKKAKIKIIKSKIKIIERDEKPENLEEELEADSNRQFSSFVSTGRMTAPVLHSGQEAQDVPEAAIRNPRQDGRAEQTTQLYETGRTLGGETRTYTASSEGAPPTLLRESRMRSPQLGQRIETGQNVLPEGTSSHFTHQIKDEELERKYEPAEGRKKRMPWE